MKVLDELKAWLSAERKARNEKKAAKKANKKTNKTSKANDSIGIFNFFLDNLLFFNDSFYTFYIETTFKRVANI